MGKLPPAQIRIVESELQDAKLSGVALEVYSSYSSSAILRGGALSRAKVDGFVPWAQRVNLRIVSQPAGESIVESELQDAKLSGVALEVFFFFITLKPRVE